jgi:hypothetical protein
MKSLRFSCYALAVCTAVTIFAGCGAPQGQIAGLGPMRGVGGSPAAQGSWMSAGSSEQDLLYVADFGTNKVYAFSYPKGQLVGTLTGFNGPWADCADNDSNVWITNFVGKSVVEYEHGGASPIQSLTDPKGYPAACSIDPATGNLAIANVYSRRNGSGNVLIYDKASGTPTEYTSPDLYYYDSTGYDARGDLFVDGTTRQGHFKLVELASHGKSFTTIALGKHVPFPVGVQWLKDYLAIGAAASGNASDSAVLQVKVAKGNGSIVGQSKLAGTIGAFFVHGSTLVASEDATLDFFSYPAGGSPTKTIDGLDYPLGVTISVTRRDRIL